MKTFTRLLMGLFIGSWLSVNMFGNINDLQNDIEQPGITVRGNVTDESGGPLVGVTVQIVGTTTGVITDASGNYVLENVFSDAILRFSFVGYLTKEVTVGNQTTININLVPEIKELDEVVVIGYGTQRKVEVTSAVASVKSDEFIQGSVQDAMQLIQGKVAGLNIVTPSGDPNANSQILLRGNTTISSSTAPLVLIDGIPGDINTVAPQDIESIDVLKDGSAAAIYGTRGTNGIILITTRNPTKVSETTIEYHGFVSTQQLFNQPDMLSAAEVRQKIEDGTTAFPDYGSETDWIDEVTREIPVSHEHNLLFRGGSGQTNYTASFNYKSLQGIIIESNNKNFNGRATINHNMFDDKVRFRVGITSSDNRYNTLARNGSFDGKIFRLATVLNPTAPVKDENGNWFEQPAVARFENPLALIYESDGENQSQTQRLNGSVIYEPIKSLQLKVLGSRTKYNGLHSYMETKNHISTVRDGLNGYASRSNSQSIDRLLELTAQYTMDLKSHKMIVLVGYSFQDNFSESDYMQNWNFPPGDYSYKDDIGKGLAIPEGNNNMISAYKGKSNLIGFFGRITYNYKEKYLLLASIRREASSRFVGTDELYYNFPSLSIGWRISEESFMDNVEVINYLKIRAGYGVTGTAPDRLFLGVPQLSYSGYFLVDGEWVPTLQPVSNPNKGIHWEMKKEQNYGVDFGFLNNRINGSFDYYVRRTEDMIYEYPVPVPPFYVDRIWANAGVMENKGIEIMIHSEPVKKSKFRWETSFTFSHNNNLLVSLENEDYQLENDFSNEGFAGVPVQTYTHRLQVGQPIGNFFTYQVVGVDENGQWLYTDTLGNPTTDVAIENKRIVGNGMPKSFLSWNNRLVYGNFDLNINMRGAFGFQILNFFRMYYEVPGYTLFNQLESAYDKVYGQTLSNNTPLYNSYYIEDGDYLKIDNITLGYNFKVQNIKHFKSLRLYTAILNGFIFTKYKGMDPEVDTQGLTPGNDNRDKYPTTRTFTLGVNVVFN